MKRLPLWLAFALTIVALQTTVTRYGEIGSVRPDLVILAVLFFAMRGGYVTGTLWGVLLGAVQDAASGGVFGFNIMTKGWTGFAVGHLRPRLDFENPSTQVLAAFFATCADGLMNAILAQAFFPEKTAMTSFFRLSVPVAVYHSFLFPLLMLAGRVAGRRLGISARRVRGADR